MTGIEFFDILEQDYERGQLIVTAYHETGHYLMGLFLRSKLPTIFTIERSAGCVGRVNGLSLGDWESDLLLLGNSTTGKEYLARKACENALFSIGGLLGVETFLGDDDFLGAEGDIDELWKPLVDVFGSNADDAYSDVKTLCYRAMSYAATRKAGDCVATYLLEHRTLSMGQISVVEKMAVARLGKWHNRIETIVENGIEAIVEKHTCTSRVIRL